MTKSEKKLQKQLKKADKTIKKLIKELTKVDKSIRKLPIDISLQYNLENNYFKNIPPLLSKSVYLQAGIEATLEIIESEEDGGN